LAALDSGRGLGIKQPDARSWLMMVSTPSDARPGLMMVSTPWEDTPLKGADDRERFEQALLPHMDAAYNLARWLTRDDHDAEDLVQAAYLRALKFFGGSHMANNRAWLLTIVRNTCYTWLEQKRSRGTSTTFDEEIHGEGPDVMDPETQLLRKDQKQSVRRAVEELPPELREVVVLREMEGLSYKEIAAIAEIPQGTVMSRLSRARERLRQRLGDRGDWES
jgi:RNA polymerase sigma factor (sigma-70 family)